MPCTIDAVRLRQVNLPPKVVRTDAIQSFVTQETLLLTLRCSDGIEATGYAYTIGTGGSSIVALLRDHLAPRLIGRDPVNIEAIWKDLFFHTHATAVGAITSLALACVDTALWDWRAQSQGLLHQFCGAQMQPAAFRGVHRHTGLGPAQQLPQRQLLTARAPVPQGGVHTGQGQTGDGAHGRGMGVEKQVLPDRFNMQRVAPQQPRRKMVMQQRHDGRAAGADGVGITGGLDAIAAGEREQHGLLRHKGLDGVGTHHFGWQIDLAQPDRRNGQRSGHRVLPDNKVCNMCDHKLVLPPVQFA